MFASCPRDAASSGGSPARPRWPPVAAQSPRTGVVRLVVGFVPGGAADRVARVVAPELGRALGRNVIVENVAGANGVRAIARVAAAEPDGDTLLYATSAIANPADSAGIGALRPLIVTSTVPMVLAVRASLPVRDVEDFVRYVAQSPAVSYGSAGVGNATHLCAAELLQRLGLDAIHVPYPGSNPVMTDLIGGHTDFGTIGASSTLAQQTGVRMLAVTTLTRSRLPAFATLPTLAETVAPGFDWNLWQAIFVPAATPEAVLAQLGARMREVLAQDSVRAALGDAGAEVVSGSQEDAQRIYRAETERFRRLTGAGGPARS